VLLTDLGSDFGDPVLVVLEKEGGVSQVDFPPGYGVPAYSKDEEPTGGD
jgi:hypothetical protein